MTSIVFPESVTTISEGAFWGCGLTSVTIPKSVTMIESFAFRGCRSLTSIVVNGDNPVYDSRDNCNAIIETASNTLLQGFKCTEIPATVTKIANGAFCGLGLTSFYIPENITEIEGNPFQDWDSFDITSIEVAEGNPVYDSRDNCNAIIETSTNTMLMGCINTTFPSSVTNIGEYAFRNCGYLTSIVIPSSITSIGNEAFTGCNNLSSVTFSEGLVSIGAGAFYDIPITSITIPSSVTSIGVAAFGHANERNRTVEIVVNEGNTVYDSRNNCNAIIETSTNTLLNGCENTVIPSSVSHIGDWAFGPCEFTAITNDPSQAGGGCFYIPSSVTSIGHGAFFNNYSLTTFALPESLTELGEDALGGGVTSLISTRTNPFFLDPNIGIGVAMNCVLHVPAGTKASYIAAGWTEEVFGGGIVEDGEAAPDFVSVSLSSVGASTFCSKYNLDFSGTEDIKAYIVSAFTPSTGEATLTRIKYVPALTGIVLLGNEGAYDIPVTDKQTVVANLLVGVTGRTQLSRNEGRYTNFVLANGSSGLGFYTVVDGSTLAANRAYLPLLTYLLPTSASSISIRFDDDATMIDDMEAECETTAWHDLSGRKMDEQPTAKGVYIVNGKKIVVK